ncbi:tRNA(fMet)-specific endonuclease VapC [Cyclobacterium xiamenense]|uniref:tRNA(fMet)-specific endonuclease VapC n=1 Tax=Cyclobacterium xiamenense TaxID=1297121 RepID=A0A1H6ZLI2_9BACT|nr:tRNA(fMet)-specific endonuclease VapC [Cyclobacterium xiamenense]
MIPNIVSYFLKGNDNVNLMFQQYLRQFENIHISIITYYEIVSGLTFKDAKKQLLIFEHFCSTTTLLYLTKDSIRRSAAIYSKQRAKGETIDDIDILIAGIAISNNLCLVTNNVRHFGKIEGLVVENWNN